MALELKERMKTRYYEVLEEYSYLKNQKPQATMKEKWVSVMIERVLYAKAKAEKHGHEKLSQSAALLLKGYDVTTANNKHALVKKSREFKPGRKETLNIVVPLEQSFNIVLKSHIITNHGNTNDMFEWLDSHNYAVASRAPPILREICRLMNPACIQAQEKNTPKKKINETPTNNLSSDKNTVSVNFLDMSLQPDNSFNYILIYKHIESGFIQLRPLTAIDLVEEVAMELMKIFCDFSPPKTIRVQWDMKPLFVAVLERLNSVFTDKISLFTCESVAVNSQVEAKIKQWMLANESQVWSIGCHFVQWEINNTSTKTGIAFVKFFGRTTPRGKLRKKIIDTTNALTKCSKTKTKESAKTKSKPAKKESNKKEMRNVTDIIAEVKRDKHKTDVTETQPAVEPKFPMFYSTDVKNIEYEISNTQISKLATPIKANDLSISTASQICHTCARTVVVNGRFCCICNNILHLYCGVRRQNLSGDKESVCYTCLKLF